MSGAGGLPRWALALLSLGLAFALGAACTASDGTCHTSPDCPVNQGCVEGRCRPTCQANGDCAPYQRCSDGVCLVRGGACGKPSDCRDDEVCAQKRCRALCVGDGGCREGGGVGEAGAGERAEER